MASQSRAYTYFTVSKMLAEHASDDVQYLTEAKQKLVEGLKTLCIFAKITGFEAVFVESRSPTEGCWGQGAGFCCTHCRVVHTSLQVHAHRYVSSKWSKVHKQFP